MGAFVAEPSPRVIRFPPLPERPEPPFCRVDPRQDRFRAIVGNIAAAAGEDAFHVAVANTVSGYPASGLDVGRLKTALESGLVSFDMALSLERWETDVFEWLRKTAFAWVQRCKRLTLEPKDTGIRVEIETQDDLGYYTYAFDVFPGKKQRS